MSKTPTAKTKIKTNKESDTNAESGQAENTAVRPTFFEAMYGNQPDHGDESKYYYLSYTGLDKDGERVVGAVSAYSKGGLSLRQVKAQILEQNNLVEVSITAWKPLASRDELNALYAAPSEIVSTDTKAYYFIHYSYIDDNNQQAFGDATIYTNGALNLHKVNQWLSEQVGTPSVFVLTWQVIETEEEYLAMSS